MKRFVVALTLAPVRVLKVPCLALMGAVAVFALFLGNARADTVLISDLGEGTPTVTATNQSSIIFLPGSGADFLHFLYTSTDQSVPAGSVSQDQLEPGGGVSDRLLLTFDGTNVVDIQFDSRDTILIPQGSGTFEPVTEDGNFNGFGIASDGYAARSAPLEASAVPEINSGSMASAFVVLTGGVLMLRARRRRI
jgi:hypothetical protein